MKKSKLDPHADWIAMQLRNGANIQEVRDLLASKKRCSVKHETLRKWISSRKPVGYTGRKPGRPKSSAAVGFKFLDASADKGLPLFVTRFFPSAAPKPASPHLAAGGLALLILERLGLQIDENIPKYQWTLKPKDLQSMTDLEILMLAYILSDLDVPPLPATAADMTAKNTKAFERWWFPLVRIAMRLKAAIASQDEILVGSLLSPDPVTKGSKS